MRNNPVLFNDPTGHKECDYKCQIEYEGADPEFEHYCEDCIWDVREQRENEEVAESILYGGTELVSSILFEPADWAYTAYHCANGDCSPWMLAGLLPFVPSSAGRYADDTVDLLRAVGRSELDDIFVNKIFRPKPGGGSFDAKLFWRRMDSAQGFAKHYNLTDIVKVTVPKDVFEHASQIWSNLDQLGPAAGWIDEGLDYFNDAIISITHVWSK